MAKLRRRGRLFLKEKLGTLLFCWYCEQPFFMFRNPSPRNGFFCLFPPPPPPHFQEGGKGEDSLPSRAPCLAHFIFHEGGWSHPRSVPPAIFRCSNISLLPRKAALPLLPPFYYSSSPLRSHVQSPPPPPSTFYTFPPTYLQASNKCLAIGRVLAGRHGKCLFSPSLPLPYFSFMPVKKWE